MVALKKIGCLPENRLSGATFKETTKYRYPSKAKVCEAFRVEVMTYARKISMQIFQLSEYLRCIFVRKYRTNIRAYFPENPRKST